METGSGFLEAGSGSLETGSGSTGSGAGVGANLLGVLLAAVPATGPRPGVLAATNPVECAAARAAVNRGDRLVGAAARDASSSIATAASSMRSRAEAAAASLGDVLGDETGEMSAIAVDTGAASAIASGSGSVTAATGESTSIAVGSGVAFFTVDVLADRRARWDEPFDAVDSFAAVADDSG